MLLELMSESEKLERLDGVLLSSETLSVRCPCGEGAAPLPFSVEEWMDTWSVGKAVLQGMGLEITIDFLVFDFPDVLLEKQTFSYIKLLND